MKSKTLLTLLLATTACGRPAQSQFNKQNEENAASVEWPSSPDLKLTKQAGAVAWSKGILPYAKSPEIPDDIMPHVKNEYASTGIILVPKFWSI
ncbi:hypothetical protein EBR21_09945 [bacterium]|nr:hypothetical protein [bacterium]